MNAPVIEYAYVLHNGQSLKAIVKIVADDSGLYRIAWPDIGLSDVANLTRCKQAAEEWAEHQLLTEDRKSSVARRLKSLNNFRWSAPYSDLNQEGGMRTPLCVGAAK